MNIIKFNNFIFNIGHILPANFNYNISVGSLVRFADSTKNSKNKNLWVKNIDNNIFVFGNWATSEKYTYIDDENQSQEKIDINNIEYEKAKIEKENIQIRKSKSLQTLYNMLPCADDYHPYLIKKNIHNHVHIRQKDNMLVVPLYGIEKEYLGVIQSLQYISRDGSKKFASGAKFKGSWLPLNESSNKSFIFVEGFSTAMSILKEVLKNKIDVTIIICFNCSNIINIVKFIDYQYSDAELNIYADNDISCAGLNFAKKAQQHISKVKITLPPLTDAQKKVGLSDFNDYLNLDL